MRALEKTVEHAKRRSLLTIVDAKRNDIGSTAQAYANAYLGEVPYWAGNTVKMLDADAITVNAYLGIDGIKPFLESVKRFGKGIFILVRTSNPSAGQIQDIAGSSGIVYEAVANLVHTWGCQTVGTHGYSSVGAVVGATYPEEAASLRSQMPNAFFLVPGYGAQGGSAQDVASCFDSKGLGAIVNSSRGIIFAYERDPWRQECGEVGFSEAATAATLRMKEDLNEVRALH
jgi:orotidine-5'-phosphate decarboxylase